MSEVNTYVAVVLSGIALFISVVSFFNQKKGQEATLRYDWDKEIISWSSGVVEEIGNVLNIFEQLKYGIAYEVISSEISVSKHNISALLDFGSLLISNAKLEKEKPDRILLSVENKKRALKAIHGVYGRICLVMDSGGKIDVDESIMYVAQCRNSFVSEVKQKSDTSFAVDAMTM
ncbi:hypothetical protein [Solidesulfovibrio sp.]